MQERDPTLDRAGSHNEEDASGKVRQEGIGKRRVGHAPTQAGHTSEWIGTEGDEPEAGRRHRPERGAEEGRKGSRRTGVDRRPLEAFGEEEPIEEEREEEHKEGGKEDRDARGKDVGDEQVVEEDRDEEGRDQEDPVGCDPDHDEEGLAPGRSEEVE